MRNGLSFVLLVIALAVLGLILSGCRRGQIGIESVEEKLLKLEKKAAMEEGARQEREKFKNEKRELEEKLLKFHEDQLAYRRERKALDEDRADLDKRIEAKAKDIDLTRREESVRKAAEELEKAKEALRKREEDVRARELKLLSSVSLYSRPSDYARELSSLFVQLRHEDLQDLRIWNDGRGSGTHGYVHRNEKRYQLFQDWAAYYASRGPRPQAKSVPIPRTGSAFVSGGGQFVDVSWAPKKK